MAVNIFESVVIDGAFCNKVAVVVGVISGVERDESVRHYAASAVYRSAKAQGVVEQRVGECDGIG